MSEKHRINFVLPEEVYQQFFGLYRYSLSRFLRNCVSRAVSDRDFFVSMFFKDYEK